MSSKIKDCIDDIIEIEGLCNKYKLDKSNHIEYINCLINYIRAKKNIGYTNTLTNILEDDIIQIAQSNPSEIKLKTHNEDIIKSINNRYKYIIGGNKLQNLNSSAFWDQVARSVQKALKNALIMHIDRTSNGSQKRLLLLLHSYYWDQGGNKWGLPGGGIEDNETPWSAAKREYSEENEVDVLSIKHNKIDTYLVEHTDSFSVIFVLHTEKLTFTKDISKSNTEIYKREINTFNKWKHRIKTNKRMFRYNGKLINDMIDIIKQ